MATSNYEAKKRASLAKGTKFTIPREEYDEIWERPNCYYCGSTAKASYRRTSAILQYNGPDEYVLKLKKKLGSRCFLTKKLSMDQMDPMLGYVSGNVTRSCILCNCAKGLLISADDFSKIAISTINRIDRLVESIPLSSTELSSEDECG